MTDEDRSALMTLLEQIAAATEEPPGDDTVPGYEYRMGYIAGLATAAQALLLGSE